MKNKKITLLTLPLFFSPNILFAEEKAYEKYNLLSGFANLEPEEFFIKLGMFGYNVCWILSIFMCGYKFIQALIIYNEQAVHPVQKNQAMKEFLEPVKGMLYLSIGLTVIKILAGIIFPGLGL